MDCAGGDDANDGLSPTSPKRTIEAALPGADEVNVDGACEIQAPLFLDRVILRGPGPFGGGSARIVGAWVQVGAGGAGIYDLRIDDGVAALGPLVIEGVQALWIGTAHAADIRNCYFYDTGSGMRGDFGLVIEGATFASGDVRIYCAGNCGPVRISRSAFYNDSSRGLALYPDKHMVVVLDSVFFPDDLSAVCVGGPGRATVTGGWGEAMPCGF